MASSKNNDAKHQQPREISFLLPTTDPDPDRTILIRHDSEFSVGSNYEYSSPNNLRVWQGAALLTADCLGTGILALPADIFILGYGVGLGFLIANLPINLYAGTILSHAAGHVEDQQVVENRIYQESLSGSGMMPNYEAIHQDTVKSIESIMTMGTQHTQLHHDTATFDFIGMTQALFGKKSATRTVMMVYYVNIFLVLGNYILVMSHAVQATFGGNVCLPIAGLIASIGMFVVSQSRTMARLGRTASILSLTTLFIVVVQCLIASQKNRWHDQELPIPKEHSLLRKLSALGSIGFAVGSQKLFLNIRHELADRSTAPKSLAISLTAFGTFYVLIVLAAGPNPPSFLFDAIPHGWNRQLAGLFLWAHVVVSYAINSQAICSSMDRLIWYRVTSDTMTDAQRWMLLTALMAITAYLVANAVPFFMDLVSLIGSLTSVPLTLLLPALFWRKVSDVPLWRPTADSLCSYALVAFATVFMVAATVGSIYSIEQDWQSHGGPFSCN